MFEWDEAKRKTNLKKHGVDFERVYEADWGQAIRSMDVRYDYGEIRIVALVPLDGRIYCCTYTERMKRMRIISLRKANKREHRYYEKKTTHQ